jgi:hypothetical protein
MLAEQFIAAAAGARNSTALDEIARLTWRAHGEGHLADADAESISEALQTRRRAFATRRAPPALSQSRPAIGLPRHASRPRSPDRQASLERRRRQAMSGAVPAKIAAVFTLGELAVLSVIAREVQRRNGACSLPIDAIAAFAGVSRTTAQNSLRQARHLGLLEVKERRRRGLPSLTNVIKVISKEWSAWLKLSDGGIGFKKLIPTGIYFNSIEKTVERDAETPDAHWRNRTSAWYVSPNELARKGGRK